VRICGKNWVKRIKSMKFENWIKRKYPNHYKQLLEGNFNDLDWYLKTLKYKVGILTKDNGENKVGDLCLYKRHKEYGEHWNGLYSEDCGWTGSFEYVFYYQKPSDHWCTKSYVLNCEEVKPYGK